MRSSMWLRLTASSKVGSSWFLILKGGGERELDREAVDGDVLSPWMILVWLWKSPGLVGRSWDDLSGVKRLSEGASDA